MEQKTVYYASQDGRYLGAYVGFQMRPVEIPGDAVEVPSAPNDGRDIWDADAQAWTPHNPPPIEEVVAARLATADPLVRALAELLPGGLEAVTAKAKEVMEARKTATPGQGAELPFSLNG